MSDQIVNRVAKSKLITIDMEDWYPKGTRTSIDIAPWLYEGIVLREKDFRNHLNAHPWEQYQNHFVHLYCSTDAIIPSWAYMLITSKLAPYAESIVVGTLEDLETLIFTRIIDNLDLEPYKDCPVIIKGCTNLPIPENAYIQLTQKIQTVAKSVMYGEACSSVPLFKK